MNPAVAALIERSAIAGWLGFSAKEDGGGLVYALAFDEKHIGNPLIRALHGGVIAAFLEVAAQCEVAAKLGGGASVKTVNLDIDYLTSSRAQPMQARARITRMGRRLAFVEATGWQASEEKPVAKAQFRLRIGSED